jgi:hypothetical protein
MSVDMRAPPFLRHTGPLPKALSPTLVHGVPQIALVPNRRRHAGRRSTSQNMRQGVLTGYNRKQPVSHRGCRDSPTLHCLPISRLTSPMRGVPGGVAIPPMLQHFALAAGMRSSITYYPKPSLYAARAYRALDQLRSYLWPV